MLNAVSLLGQGNPAFAVVIFAAMAGFGIVPAATGAWVVWACKGRPKSGVVWVVLASVIFLLWIGAFILYCRMPSADEELAFEEVESAYPALDTGIWNYSAHHPSHDVWVFDVEGHTQAGQPIHEKFRVTRDAVEQEQSNVPSGWVIIKRWPMSGAPTSQPTSAP